MELCLARAAEQYTEGVEVVAMLPDTLPEMLLITSTSGNWKIEIAIGGREYLQLILLLASDPARFCLIFSIGSFCLARDF